MTSSNTTSANSTAMFITTATITAISISIFNILQKHVINKKQCGASSSGSSSSNVTASNSNSNSNSTNASNTYEECIGQTPLLHLQRLSSKIGNEMNIYAKMESSNPGGTGKDRAALFMLRHAEAKGDLPPPLGQQRRRRKSGSRCRSRSRGGEKIDENDHNDNDNDNDNDIANNARSGINHSQEQNQNDNTVMDIISQTIQIAMARSRTGGIVVEGTSGSTGISLATLCTQRGHSIIIVMPDDQAQEKQTILKCLGAVLHVVPTAAISNPNHYVNVARKIALQVNKQQQQQHQQQYVGGKCVKAAFMNQFENKANYNAHISTTGPEILRQTNGHIDAFCMSSGTGGKFHIVKRVVGLHATYPYYEI